MFEILIYLQATAAVVANKIRTKYLQNKRQKPLVII